MATVPNKADLRRLASVIVPRVKAHHVIDHLYSTEVIVKADYDDLIDSEQRQASSCQMRQVIRLVQNSLKDDAVLKLSEALESAGYTDLVKLLGGDNRLETKETDESTREDTSSQEQSAQVIGHGTVNIGQCSININILSSEVSDQHDHPHNDIDTVDTVDNSITQMPPFHFTEQMAPAWAESSGCLSSNTGVSYSSVVTTKSLVKDIVLYKLHKAGFEDIPGIGSYNPNPPLELHLRIREISDEFDSKFYEHFGDMTSSFDMNSSNLQASLRAVLDINFDSTITWGRLCGALTFAANLAIHARSMKMLERVADVITWTTSYLEQYRFANWISLHGGWVSSCLLS